MKRKFSVFIFSCATLKLVCAIILSAALILAAGCYEDKKSSSEDAVQNSLSVANVPPETESSVYQIAESNQSSVSSDEQKRSNDSHSAAETASKPPFLTSENQNSETKSNYTENKSTDDDNTLNSNSAQPFETDKPNDCDWIANRVFELLNEERKAAGVHTREMLTGLNKVAVLRSEQLVTQFSHKWVDGDGNEWSGAQYASTVLEYGKKEQSSICAALASGKRGLDYYDQSEQHAKTKAEFFSQPADLLPHRASFLSFQKLTRGAAS